MKKGMLFSSLNMITSEIQWEKIKRSALNFEQVRGVPGFSIRDGSHVHFWVDEWLGGCLLCHSFPRLFGVVVNNCPLLKSATWETRVLCLRWCLSEVLQESKVSEYESSF